MTQGNTWHANSNELKHYLCDVAKSSYNSSEISTSFGIRISSNMLEATRLVIGSFDKKVYHITL